MNAFWRSCAKAICASQTQTPHGSEAAPATAEAEAANIQNAYNQSSERLRVSRCGSKITWMREVVSLDKSKPETVR